ncbi:hypothetical protein, partial [Enterobacter hormaechei]|uniref:hypothetical protein n=1 Tax=Enterobacter hormaechei TaxID=158836 RepID=UPI0022EC548A
MGRPTNWAWTSNNLWAIVFTTAPATVTPPSCTTRQTFQVGAEPSKLKLAIVPHVARCALTG